MRCLVTAGPTYEPLDRVRHLSNLSTGRLGTGLAERLAAAGHDVLLLRGRTATSAYPTAAVRVEDFGSGSDLGSKFLCHATDEPISIFHAAAVSDFSVVQTYERDAGGHLKPLYGGKLPTTGGTLMAELRPTPKLLAGLRAWYPNAFIVGWKYEVDGTRDDVVARCREQLSTCGSDLSVANGPAYGDGFGLVTTERHEALDGADALFAALVGRVATAPPRTT